MIKIIASGKIKEKYLNELIQDYSNRIKKYHKIEVVELKDMNNLKIESDNIIKNINQNDFVIVLDIHGKKIDSNELACLIDKTFQTNSTIVFVIGSSLGLSDEIKQRANYLLSFSDMTIPHGLFRGILLEQIYRSFKILNNESYHK